MFGMLRTCDSDLDLEEEEEEDADFGLDLMDLPDHALANAFFSGFLDSIKVVSCLRLVSKRMMAVGSDSCKVTSRERKRERTVLYCTVLCCIVP